MKKNPKGSEKMLKLNINRPINNLIWHIFWKKYMSYYKLLMYLLYNGSVS